MPVWLKNLLGFFSLETLDTRLFPPKDLDRKNAIIKKADPKSKWNTWEFRFYMVVFAIAVPLMYKAAMDASNETNPNYPKFAHLLSQGWMFGRKVDNSDQQYRFFRDNFPLLCGLILLHTSLRRGVNLIIGNHKRTGFDFVFGLIFIIAVHGTNFLRILIHLVINFSISKYIKRNDVATALTWIYGVLSLFLNDNFRTVRLGIGFIDNGFQGIIPRWDVFFNFTLLRMLSYNLDYIEKRKSASEESNLELKNSSSSLSELDDRERLVAPIPLADYNFVNYMAYITYAPLFIAGPIITFNDYIYQSDYKAMSSVKNYKRTFIYFLRFAFCVLVMEFLLHFMYVVAVSKTKAWEGDTPFQLSMLGLFNLNIIWLKLLIPWRLFRLWSLIDGIDPPENMIRCMDNNYSTLAFWRAWHRSYNRWIIRYIYVPLGGGGKYRILNSLCVFSFVAIWHDIELKLLMWGWLVVIFIIPELAATAIFKQYQNEPWYRHLCALGAVINIWMMMMANLFGFCMGKDGTISLIRSLFTTSVGLRFLILSLGALFVGAQVMFELREAEKRRGVNVKC